MPVDDFDALSGVSSERGALGVDAVVLVRAVLFGLAAGVDAKGGGERGSRPLEPVDLEQRAAQADFAHQDGAGPLAASAARSPTSSSTGMLSA